MLHGYLAFNEPSRGGSSLKMAIVALATLEFNPQLEE
jgi:hypothetical protein